LRKLEYPQLPQSIVSGCSSDCSSVSTDQAKLVQILGGAIGAEFEFLSRAWAVTAGSSGSETAKTLESVVYSCLSRMAIKSFRKCVVRTLEIEPTRVSVIDDGDDIALSQERKLRAELGAVDRRIVALRQILMETNDSDMHAGVGLIEREELLGQLAAATSETEMAVQNSTKIKLQPMHNHSFIKIFA